MRLLPFERTSTPAQSMFQANWFGIEFWRFVLMQQVVAQYAETFIDFPPMQKGASFNLEQVKEEMQKKIEAHSSQ